MRYVPARLHRDCSAASLRSLLDSSPWDNEEINVKGSGQECPHHTSKVKGSGRGRPLYIDVCQRKDSRFLLYRR